MPWFALACSAGLLIYCSHLCARRCAHGGAEHLFIALAAAAIQIGFISIGLSCFNLLIWQAWLVVQASVFCLLAWFPGGKRQSNGAISRAISFVVSSRLAMFISILIALIFAITLAKQIFLPVSNMDDRNYHASRAGYWLEHGNIFPWTTHNDRQIVFPLGGELIFFWPILFTRSEMPALLVFWLAYPLAAAGVFATLRQLRQSPLIAGIGALLFCCTPMVLLQTRGVNPEIWMTCFAVICGFWMVRALNEPSTTRFVMAGIFAGLALNARATALPLLLVAPVVPLLVAGAHAKLRAGASILVGATIAILLGGSIVVFANNIVRFHHPLGPEAFREVHTAELSARQVRTHVARTLVALLEPPAAPTENTRDAIAHAYTKILSLLDADTPLPLEDADWPGPYHVVIKPIGENYSFAGLLWVPALLIAIAIGARRSDSLSQSLFALALLAVPLLVAVVFRIRWMGGMPRFWIAPFAMSVPIIVALVAPATRRTWIRAICIIAIAITIALGLGSRWHDTYQSLNSELSPVGLDEPYFEPLARISDGSTILLVGGQGTRDYPLFRPRDEFANRVVSWGKGAFDSQRMQEILGREKIEYVIIENDRRLDFHWDPPLDTTEMVGWFDSNPHWRPIPLPYTPGMRLYVHQTASSTRTAE